MFGTLMFLRVGPIVSSIVWDHWLARGLFLSISAGEGDTIGHHEFSDCFHVLGGCNRRTLDPGVGSEGTRRYQKGR